jgi:hypothetical protein
MSTDSMATSAPSAWLTMENAMARLSTDVTIVALLTAILVALSLLSILRGTVDLGFLLAIAVLLALRSVRDFCRGAMERMRQLSQLV